MHPDMGKCIVPLTQNMGKKLAAAAAAKKNPCFFKIMIGDFANKLRLPPAFVSTHNGLMESKSIVTRIGYNHNPTVKKSSWKVTLKKIEKDLFFDKGWSVFAKDNYLEIGDFLVFTFISTEDSRLVFHARVFGTTGCEKGIKLLNQNVDSAKKISASGTKRRRLEEVPCSSSKPKTSIIPNGNKGKLQSNQREPKRKLQGRLSVTKKSEQSNLKQAFHVHDEEHSDDDSVEILGSSDPFCNKEAPKIRTGRSPTHSNTILRQLSKRIKLNGTEQLEKEMSDNISENGLIPVDYNGQQNESMTSSHVYSSHKNNDHDEGDPTENDNFIASTPSVKDRPDSITEENSTGSPITGDLSNALMCSTKMRSPTTEQIGRALKVARSFKVSNPSHLVVLRPSYLSNFVGLQYGFVEKYLNKRLVGSSMNKGVKNARLQGPDGRLWPVRLRHSKSHSYICNGWKDFLLEYDLGEGDVCVFELLKTTSWIHLKVSFFRVLEDVAPLSLVPAKVV